MIRIFIAAKTLHTSDWAGASLAPTTNIELHEAGFNGFHQP